MKVKGGELMATLRIPVKQNILKWVWQTASEQLNDNNRETLSNWISGAKVPTIRQLEDMSKKTHIPFGYFFLNDVPDEDIAVLKFRTVNNVHMEKPSRDLIDVINDVQTKQVWLSEYRQQEGFEANGFNNGFRNHKSRKNDSYNIAKDILDYLGLEIDWSTKVKGNRFKYLRNMLDDAGVTTICSSYVINSTRRSLNPDEFRAFALSDKYAPFIFINSNDSFNAMLFSLAHELVHIWYGTSETYNYDYKSDLSVSEQDINKVCEHILFPDKIFKNEWNKLAGLDNTQKIFELEHVFGTSPLSIAIKALHLHLIDQNVVTTIKHELNEKYQKIKQERKNSEGGPNYYTVKAYHMDKSFVQDVDRSVKSGDITYTKAFELLNVKGTTGYDKLLEAAK